jgi:hypothetical protein
LTSRVCDICGKDGKDEIYRVGPSRLRCEAHSDIEKFPDAPKEAFENGKVNVVTKLDIQFVLDRVGLLRLEAEALAGMVTDWGEVPGVDNEVVAAMAALDRAAEELVTVQNLLRDALEDGVE